MIKRLSQLIVSMQLNKGVISKDKVILLEYGYRVFIGKLLSGVIFLSIAAITHTILEMLIFLALFIPLRQYAGGFHFKREEVCICFSAIISFILANFFLKNTLSLPQNCFIWVNVILFMFIWKVAPIETMNKKLDETEKIFYANKTKVILIFEMTIFITCNYFYILKIVQIIIGANLIVTLGLAIEIVYKKSKEKSM